MCLCVRAHVHSYSSFYSSFTKQTNIPSTHTTHTHQPPRWQVLIVPWAAFCNSPPAAVLRGATPLQVLDLSGSRLGSTELRQVRRLLCESECKLTTLRLRGCGLRDQHFPQLLALLKENPSIHSLNLEGNKLELLSALKSTFPFLQRLHSLNLSNNRFNNQNVSDEFVCKCVVVVVVVVVVSGYLSHLGSSDCPRTSVE